MDIEKPQKVVREIVTNVEEEEESVVEERNKLERAVMTRLASPCLQQLEAALQENRSARSLLRTTWASWCHSENADTRSVCCVHIHFFFTHVYMCTFLMAGSNEKCGRMFKCSWLRLLSSGTHPISPTILPSNKLPVFMAAPYFTFPLHYLFRTLFQSEFASFSHLSKEQLLDMFKG